VTIRDQRLAIYFAAGDKLSARTYILTVPQTGDQRGYREHYYLHTFDPMYRSSGGEQITKESYDFLMRLHRISNREKRHGTRPAEYVPITQPDGLVVYKRISRERFEGDVFDEIEKKTARELNQVAQELYESMVRIGGGHFEIDEKFGAQNAPFGMKQEDWEKKRWLYEHKDLRTTFGTHKTEQVYNFAKGANGWYKLDTDQLMIMARWLAGIEMSKGIGPHGRPIDSSKIGRGEDPFTEHSRLALSEAFNHYAHKLAEYRQYRAEGHDPIPEYERFIHYIEKFKEKILAKGDTGGALTEQEKEANTIAETEPVPVLSRAPEETLNKLNKVEGAIEDKGTGDKMKPGLATKLKREFDLFAKDIPLAFRNFLRKDLTRLRDLLRHPDELDDVVVKIYHLEQFLDNPDISDERKAQFQAECRQYQQGCYEALVALRPFYLQNRARIDVLEALSNWRNNFAPFRNKVATVNNKTDVSNELTQTKQKIDQLFKKPYFDEGKKRFVFETYQPMGVIERQVQSLQFLPEESELKETEIYRQLDKRLDEPGRNRELKEEDKPRWYYFQLKAYEMALTERVEALHRMESEQQAQAA
ncbi:hypothetical protein HY065_02775, partial [Candidatus Berkelbacteria bacterium]|nr:hypothetical protein [Candidatus Berkelbacteria bacterium]